MEEDDPPRYDSLGRRLRSSMFYKGELLRNNPNDSSLNERSTSSMFADHQTPLTPSNPVDSTNHPSSNQDILETQREKVASPYDSSSVSSSDDSNTHDSSSVSSSDDSNTQSSSDCSLWSFEDLENALDQQTNKSSHEEMLESDVLHQRNDGLTTEQNQSSGIFESPTETETVQMPVPSNLLLHSSAATGSLTSSGKRLRDDNSQGDRPTKAPRCDDVREWEGRDPSSPSSPDSSSSSSTSSSSTSSSGSSSTSNASDSSSERTNKFTVLKEKYSLDEKVIEVNGKLRSKMDYLLTAQCLASRHNLSDVAIEDLLKSYNCQLGQEVIPASTWLFNKIFSYDSGLEYHFYCSQCEAYLGEKLDLERKGDVKFKCPVELCKHLCDISTMNDGHFFVVLPLKRQVKCFLESQSDIDELVSYRFTRDRSDDTVRDIFDGLQYKNLSKRGGILHELYNFSVTLFTDGAQVFSYGTNSLWPIMCRLNELPPNKRFNVDNIFITGIWFGRSKPNMTVYLTQYVKEAATLYNEGLHWSKSDGEVVHSKIVTLNCCLDLVALATVQRTLQYNAYMGCGLCYHPGFLVDLTNDVLARNTQPQAEPEGSGSENDGDYVGDPLDLSENREDGALRRQKKVVKQVRYSFCEGVHPARTDAEMRADMLESELTGKSVRGVVGVSPLFVLLYFNLVHGFVIDYMHAVLLGTTKHLLSLWLDSEHAKKDFSVRHRIEEINECLQNFKPPSKLYKRFESLHKFSQYKANMLEPWLLFYSLPCLVGILTEKYLKHFALLVTSTYILLSECVTQAQLHHCEELLLKFVEDFETLYGPSRMVYNVHLLVHLVNCVRNWGPLWAYSAFSFESGNGMLKKLVKGTTGVMTQIARKYTLIRFLPKILQYFDISDDVKKFCSDILIVAKRCQAASKYSKVTLLGDAKVEPLSEEECELLEGANLPKERNCYERMIINGIKYHSSFYSRQGKRTYDGGVYLKDKTFGKIHRMFVVNNKVYVIMRSVNIEQDVSIVVNPLTNGTASHIKVCRMYPFGDLKIIQATDICDKCIILKTSVGTYVTVSPNRFNKD